jgi:hypothetical protein
MGDRPSCPEKHRAERTEPTISAVLRLVDFKDLVGSEVAVNLTDGRYGAADGYLANFSGRLARVDEPIPGIDAPVHYFRLENEDGFAIHEAMFERAGWQTAAGLRELRVELRGGMIITVQTQ